MSIARRRLAIEIDSLLGGILIVLTLFGLVVWLCSGGKDPEYKKQEPERARSDYWNLTDEEMEAWSLQRHEEWKKRHSSLK